jgi:low affinity Fe/Cu permease
MIIWILLIALVVTAAAILVGIVFGRAKSKGYRNGIYIGVGICAVLITFCMVLGGIYHSEVSDLQAQYDDIMLYNEVVELCENEQVRFGHYEKIQAFNEAYDRLAAIEEDFIFGTLFPKNWSADMSKIDFYFRGVSYEGVE